MLSRIAESLYWIGRYVERAEDTSRILDVHYHLLLEDRLIGDNPSSSLFDVMGVHNPGQEGDSGLAMESLAWDPSNPASIVGSLRAAWQNSKSARSTLSSELFRALNTTYLSIPIFAKESEGQPPHAFFDWVKERAAAISGVADSTLSHDDGWRFLVLGRSLERADMTVRLLFARLSDSRGATGWITTLRCCSGYEAFLRTYQRTVDQRGAAEFLLLDRLFPRSVYSSLVSAEQCLMELDPSQGRAGPSDHARRAVGMARNLLEFTPIDQLMERLPGELAELQRLCAETSSAIAERYFRQFAPVEWSA